METASAKSSPRDFFLYFLAIGTLYISVWRFIDLLFEYINHIFPDALDYSWGFNSAIRWSISSLLIIFPVYLGITWYLRKDAIAHPEKRELRVRKWLLNFTLFLAAVTIISDLVVLVNRFLEGEITTRFILKVFVVLVVAGAVFGYYFWDLRRETKPDSKPSRILAIIAAVAVFGSIAAGFFIIGSPAAARQLRFDERRANDLQMLQGEIINYWQQKNQLPKSLDDLKDSIRGFTPPNDPQTNASYEYNVLGSLQFELCAVFKMDSQKQNQHPGVYYEEPYDHNWKHGKGRTCFYRTIDPDLYRIKEPYPKPQRVLD
ncbi:sulfite exporter TauE/SafE family protein [Candidatus Peregrinibacteria bacterium]|nr:sulfite exporter TauE/SafE family protein [Candidatus Peregrinibacteria bacterium]